MRLLIDQVNLPPLSTVFVPGGVITVLSCKTLKAGNVQLLLGKGIGIARGITELKDGGNLALLPNFRKDPQYLTKGTAAGHVEELPDSAAIYSI